MQSMLGTCRLFCEINYVAFPHLTWVKQVSRHQKCVFSVKYMLMCSSESHLSSSIRLQRVLNNSCMYNKGKHMLVSWFIQHHFPNGFRQSPIFPLTTLWIHYSCWHFHHPTNHTSTLHQQCVNTHHKQWLLFLYWPPDCILMCRGLKY